MLNNYFPLKERRLNQARRRIITVRRLITVRRILNNNNNNNQHISHVTIATKVIQVGEEVSI
jgi:hypothetical protein